MTLFEDYREPDVKLDYFGGTYAGFDRFDRVVDQKWYDYGASADPGNLNGEKTDLTGTLHELTFSCYHRMPLPANSRWRGMLSEAVDRALRRDSFCLVAFVHVPEHMHLLVWPMEPYPWASTAGQAGNASRSGQRSSSAPERLGALDAPFPDR